MKKLFAFFLITISLFLIPLLCEAQYTDLFNFSGINGAYPYGPLTISRNKVFGITPSGGIYGHGCIFSIDTNGNGFTDLFDFNGTNGSGAQGALTLSGKVFYGITKYGGAVDSGCIFSIDTNGAGYIDLFDFNGTNGATPCGSLTLSNAVLYGMTRLGGTNDDGIVFSIDTNGIRFKNLLNFDSANGRYPRGSLTYSNGVLYGMSQGLLYYYGNIFSLDTNGNNYKDLFDFNTDGGHEGAGPDGALTLSEGVLYGMAAQGGANDDGCVFSIDTNGNNYIDMLDFDKTNGWAPRGSFIYSSGALYGMTEDGGVGSGNIFSIDTNGNGYKNMYVFYGANGYAPCGTLTLAGNTLFGMTLYGGTNDSGVIFKIDTSALASVEQLSVVSSQWSVYPNPSTGVFTFSITNYELGITNIEVFNVLGEQVYSQFNIQNSSIIVDLLSQPNGVYFYRAISSDGEEIRRGKIVIQK